MGEDALFNLRWDAQRSALLGSVAALYRDESFVDLTIVTNGQMFKAHKLLLSASSPYLKTILESVPSQHAVLFMPHVTSTDLSNVLKFIYEGEIKINRRALKSFLETAKTLKIKGMDFDLDDELEDLDATTSGTNHNHSNSNSTGTGNSNGTRATSPSKASPIVASTPTTVNKGPGSGSTPGSGSGSGQGNLAPSSSASHPDENEPHDKLKILSSLLLKQEPSEISNKASSISQQTQSQSQLHNSQNNNHIPNNNGGSNIKGSNHSQNQNPSDFRDHDRDRDIKIGNGNSNQNQQQQHREDDSPSGEMDESDEDMTHDMDMLVEDGSEAGHHRRHGHHRIIRMDGSGGEIIDIDEDGEGLDEEGNYHDQEYSDDDEDIHSISILPEVSLQESDESYNLSNVHHLQQALKLRASQGGHHGGGHLFGSSQQQHQQQLQLKALGMNKLRPLVPKSSSGSSSAGGGSFNEGILLRMMREPLLSSSKTTSPASSSAGSTATGTGMTGGNYYDLGHGDGGVGGLRKTKRYVQCGSCSKVLSSLSALKRHMEDVHCARIQGKCIICGRVYSSRNSLLTHVYSAHKKHHDYKAVARIIRESDFEKFASA